MIISFDIPDAAALRVVEAYAPDNDTELTDAQFTRLKAKGILKDAFNRKIQDHHRLSAELLTDSDLGE